MYFVLPESHNETVLIGCIDQNKNRIFKFILFSLGSHNNHVLFWISESMSVALCSMEFLALRLDRGTEASGHCFC